MTELIGDYYYHQTFQFRDQFYNQTEGMAMKKPLSYFIANICMSNLEIVAKETLQSVPSFLARYIDVIFTVFKNIENLKNVVSTLNLRNSTTKLPYET